jgi:shikimate kinase
MKRHVLLVGLPGCGKSAVGKLVADGLPAPLLDIDSILVRQMGMPVAQIFGMVGESRFREMEHKAVQAAVGAEEPAVIVPGGGWAAQQGHMHWAGQSCLRVYLRCSAKAAARRVEEGEERPLLAGADPLESMRKLLEAREPFYKLADYELAAEGDSAHVAAGVLELARRHGGW